MMASEIFEFDAAWAEKWTKTGVPFLSAPTVNIVDKQHRHRPQGIIDSYQ